MKKAVLGSLIGLCISGLGAATWASQGTSINDQILSDYRNAQTFQQFVEKLTRNSFPGELRYVRKVWKTYPELLKDTALPKLIYENKQFVLREGPSEVRLQVVEQEHYQFLINDQKVSFNRYDLPSQKMKKIMEATKSRKTAHFVLMPVVWAAGQGQPSKLDVAVDALLNAFMDNQGLTEDEKVWKYAETNRFAYDTFVVEKKKISEKCFKEIQHLENVFEQENKAPFSEMKCEGKDLDVSLSGKDSDKKIISLRINSEKIVIRKELSADSEVGMEAYTFLHNSKDEESLENKEYGEDESVADRSSPFQRDQNFGPATPADEAHIEYLYRFLDLAANPTVRDFCGSCGKDLNAYANLVKTVDSKTSHLKKGHKDAKDAKTAK